MTEVGERVLPNPSSVRGRVIWRLLDRAGLVSNWCEPQSALDHLPANQLRLPQIQAAKFESRWDVDDQVGAALRPVCLSPASFLRIDPPSFSA